MKNYGCELRINTIRKKQELKGIIEQHNMKKRSSHGYGNELGQWRSHDSPNMMKQKGRKKAEKIFGKDTEGSHCSLSR